MSVEILREMIVLNNHHIPWQLFITRLLPGYLAWHLAFKLHDSPQTSWYYFIFKAWSVWRDNIKSACVQEVVSLEVSCSPTLSSCRSGAYHMDRGLKVGSVIWEGIQKSPVASKSNQIVHKFSHQDLMWTVAVFVSGDHDCTEQEWFIRRNMS